MPAFLVRRVALLALCALLAALLLLPSLLLPGVAAQTPPPTLSPTLTPTTDPLSVVDNPSVSGVVNLFLERGIWIGTTVVLIIVAGGVLLAIANENVQTIARRFNVFQPLFTWLDTQRSLGPGLRTYLDWLKREYGRLPQIGIATEQVALDLTAVHVPLRVEERATAEAYQSRMRGETHDPAHAADGGRRGNNDDDDWSQRIFVLLSDQQVLTRFWHERFKQRGSRRRRPGTPDHDAPPVTTTRLLLLGDAGSGKTTTLRYAALRCADAFRRGTAHLLAETELGLYLPRPPLPIYVRLTHFAATLPEHIGDLAPGERRPYVGSPPKLFLDWLDQQMTTFCGVPAGLLSQQITGRGETILFLDGLDEAGDEARRAYITELITNLAQQYPQNRYVVASRTAGYGGRVRLPDFLERHISPLNATEARAVIEKWFRAVDHRLAETGRTHRSEAADNQTAKLWGVIERNDRLFEMATNPLLVTAMALLQFNNVRLPNQRARLYEKLVELLLDLWRKQQLANDTLTVSVAQLSSEQRRIEYLAFQMQQQASQAREVALWQAQEWLSPQFMQRQRLDREEADRRVYDLLESLALDSGLIQRRENGYSFSHYTFQEYLAARALDSLDTRADQPDSVAFLLAHSDNDRWRETLLLAAGHWSNGQQLGKADRLIRGLLDRRTIGARLLAAAALADIGMVDELTELRDQAAGSMRSIAFDPQHCPDHRQRNEAAALLDRLDADERPELDLARPEYWATRIEPGVFQMGDEHGYDDEKPVFLYRIRQPYALARFPVTNRQYERFLQDLRQQGREEEAEQRHPRYWPGRSFRPGEGQHPVVGVSWEDACAFAAWAHETFLSANERAAGAEIRLPTEPEWERSAAYPIMIDADAPAQGRRAYPWGTCPDRQQADEDDALLAGLLAHADADAGIRNEQSRSEADEPLMPANTGESGLDDTSAVGIFPQGAADCGAEDMAGNVWEWCSTPYQKYPLPADLQPESLDTSDRNKTYVRRGGSWAAPLSYARCGARDSRDPIYDAGYIGVRLARLFSS